MDHVRAVSPDGFIIEAAPLRDTEASRLRENVAIRRDPVKRGQPD
jgi:hypothetical protein